MNLTKFADFRIYINFCITNAAAAVSSLPLGAFAVAFLFFVNWAKEYFMNKLFTLTTISLTLLSFTSIAQNYQEQFAKCSQKFEENMSLLDKTDKISECLIGTPAPNFKATTLTGQEIELSALRGKVVILNFWTMRCASCITQLTALEKLVEDNKSKDVVLLSLAVENAATLQQFLNSHPSTLTTIANAGSIQASDFKLPALYPYTVVIDQNSNIKKMWFASRGEETATVTNFQHVIDSCKPKTK